MQKHTHTSRSLDRKHPIPLYSHSLNRSQNRSHRTDLRTLLVSLSSSTVTDQAGRHGYCKRLHIETCRATGGVKSKGKPRMSPPPRFFSYKAKKNIQFLSGVQVFTMVERGRISGCMVVIFSTWCMFQGARF